MNSQTKPILDGVVFQAIAIVKVPGSIIGNMSYSVLNLTIKDGVVIKSEMTEPTLKEATIEAAKIKFVKTFVLEKEDVQKMDAEFYKKAKEQADLRDQEAKGKRDKRAKQKAES